MPLRRGAKIAIGVGSAVVVAGVGAAIWSSMKREKPSPKPGSLLCPRHVGREPAPTMALGEGDFVVVQLQSGDGTFSEATWATVVESGSEDAVIGVITGEQVPEGVRGLRTDKHGFRLGHRLVLPRECVWEVFRPKDHGGQILCGAQILDLAKFLDESELFPIKKGLTVQPGDRAEIIVGSKESFGNAWFEKLWTRIVTISPTGQVITAVVDEDPERLEHKLDRGSVVRYNRDCIIGA